MCFPKPPTSRQNHVSVKIYQACPGLELTVSETLVSANSGDNHSATMTNMKITSSYSDLLPISIRI